MDLNRLFVPIAVAALAIVAVIAIVFNPSIMGIGFALIVIVGACSVWLMRQLYVQQEEELYEEYEDEDDVEDDVESAGETAEEPTEIVLQPLDDPNAPRT